MNKKLNLVEILKDCPKGTKLYLTTYGNVTLNAIMKGSYYPICVEHKGVGNLWLLSDGRICKEDDNGECLLFPSKDQRDWSKFKPKKERFDPNTLKPFDRVLVRDYPNDKWVCSVFSHIEPEDSFHYACILELNCKYCIPYNEDTKHLINKNEEAPEYYRYWED